MLGPPNLVFKRYVLSPAPSEEPPPGGSLRLWCLRAFDAVWQGMLVKPRLLALILEVLDMAKYSAADVASHIVTHCIEAGGPISNLQLQKILYFAQNNWLDKKGETLFDDVFEAWRYGPVVPEVYQAYSIFGKRPIFHAAQYVTTGMLEPIGRPIEPLDRETGVVVDAIADAYREKSPWALVDIAHEDGGAWAVAIKGGIGSPITVDMMLEMPCGVL